MDSNILLPSHTFCALPELVDLLGPELDPIDLASSVRVCHLWYHVLIPYLWSVVDESQYSWSKVLRITQDSELVQAHFFKYGHFIRELHVHSQAMLNIVSSDGVCTQLRVLKIYDPTDKERTHYTDPEGEFGSFWGFVYLNKDLTTLRLGSAVKELLENVSDSVCDIVLASLKNLVTLQDFTGALQPDVILKRFSSLTSFVGSGLVFAKAVDLDAHIQIRSLELTYYIEGRTFLVLLNRLRSLEDFGIAGLFDVGQAFQHDTETLLVDTPLPLQRFSLRRQDLRDIDVHLAAWIFPRMPQLTEFSANMLCEHTALSLATHATHLQVFRQTQDGDSIHYSYKPRPVVNIPNILFQSCTKLRVFDGIHHKIEASKMFERPWVCRELEVFRCQIIGLARLTDHEHTLLEILAKVERQQQVQPFQSTLSMPIGESDAILERQKQYRDRLKKTHAIQLDQHYRVYDHLSELTRLQTLDLGYEYRGVYPRESVNPPIKMVDGQEYIRYDGGPISNTLDLSLGSGLDRLATLTRLEVFGFEGVDHRIGREELGWMASNWPRLKEMRGLHEDLLPRCEPDGKRDELRMIMQGLRKDVWHRAKERQAPSP